MNKPISRPVHGIVADYPYIAIAATAPKLFDFEDEPAAASLCRTMSGLTLISAILTRAEWGWLRVIPYKWHLTLDTLSGLVAFAAPWLLGFSHNKRARNTFLAMGVAGLVAGLLSQPDESDPS